MSFGLFAALAADASKGHSGLDITVAVFAGIAALGVAVAFARYVFISWRWQNPVAVSYAISEKPGMPDSLRPSLVLNVEQTYGLRVRIEALTNVEINSVRYFLRSGTEMTKATKPFLRGSMPPRWQKDADADAMGNAQYLDEAGNLRRVRDHGHFPQLVSKGNNTHYQEALETLAPWIGYLVVVLKVMDRSGGGFKTREYPLPLEIDRAGSSEAERIQLS